MILYDKFNAFSRTKNIFILFTTILTSCYHLILRLADYNIKEQ